MSKYIGSYSPTASRLVYQSVTSTDNPSSSSATWVASGTSLTILETGTYLVIYSGGILADGAGSTVGQVRLTLNGTEIANSLKQTECSTVMLLGLIGGNSVGEGGSNIVLPVTFTAGDVLTVQFRRSTGSGSVNLRNRTLSVIKVG